MANAQPFFVTCPKGLAPLLFEELGALGIPELKASEAGVQFQGTVADAYRVCLWSRLANRVLLPLATIPANDAEDLYKGVKKLHWQKHLRPEGTLIVDVHGSNEKLMHTQFTAQKVKDAIVDKFREAKLARPNVSKDDPDLRINILVKRDTAVISLDLSGDSLHRRGYRTVPGAAPLKENLAAALLSRCQWPGTTDTAFVDPFCGSGTLVLEAIQMAANIAPGLLRDQFGFERWLLHDAASWAALKLEAEAQRTERLAQPLPQLIGYDTSAEAIALAQTTAQQLGVTDYVTFVQQDITQLQNTTGCAHGLLLTNPPYGERLNANDDIAALYQQIALQARTHFIGWQLGIFTGNPDACARIGIRPLKKYRFFNGALPCQLLQYTLATEYFYSE